MLIFKIMILRVNYESLNLMPYSSVVIIWKKYFIDIMVQIYILDLAVRF